MTEPVVMAKLMPITEPMDMEPRSHTPMRRAGVGGL
jgi:hypothetical protein